MENFKKYSEAINKLNSNLNSYEFYAIRIYRDHVILQGDYDNNVVAILQELHGTTAKVCENGYVKLLLTLNGAPIEITFT